MKNVHACKSGSENENRGTPHKNNNISFLISTRPHNILSSEGWLNVCGRFVLYFGIYLVFHSFAQNKSKLANENSIRL